MSAINSEDRTSKRKNWARSLWPECWSCWVYGNVYIKNFLEDINMNTAMQWWTEYEYKASTVVRRKMPYKQMGRRLQRSNVRHCTETEGIIRSVVEPELGAEELKLKWPPKAGAKIINCDSGSLLFTWFYRKKSWLLQKFL
jgi:hypothetical protein